MPLSNTGRESHRERRQTVSDRAAAYVLFAPSIDWLNQKKAPFADGVRRTPTAKVPAARPGHGAGADSGACESARGPDADRRGNALKSLTLAGSDFGA